MTLLSDLNIYRSARLLGKRHGDEAPIHAAMRADAMLDAGGMEGRAVWQRILKGNRGQKPGTGNRGQYTIIRLGSWRPRPAGTTTHGNFAVRPVNRPH